MEKQFERGISAQAVTIRLLKYLTAKLPGCLVYLMLGFAQGE